MLNLDQIIWFESNTFCVVRCSPRHPDHGLLGSNCSEPHGSRQVQGKGCICRDPVNYWCFLQPILWTCNSGLINTWCVNKNIFRCADGSVEDSSCLDINQPHSKFTHSSLRWRLYPGLQDFCKKVSPKAEKKAKACDSQNSQLYRKMLLLELHTQNNPSTGLKLWFCLPNMLSRSAPLAEKLAQMDEDAHILLHDITCCWLWLRERLQRAFPNDVVDRYDELFSKGLLDCDHEFEF